LRVFVEKMAFLFESPMRKKEDYIEKT